MTEKLAISNSPAKNAGRGHKKVPSLEDLLQQMDKSEIKGLLAKFAPLMLHHKDLTPLIVVAALSTMGINAKGYILQRNFSQPTENMKIHAARELASKIVTYMNDPKAIVEKRRPKAKLAHTPPRLKSVMYRNIWHHVMTAS